MKIEKGYKILASDMTSSYMCAFEVYYIENEWVGPRKNCGPLCVFDTLEHLQAFIDDMDAPWLIWECEYTPSKRKFAWHPSYGNTIIKSLVDMPKGTRLANKVRLTRRLK